MSFSFVRQNNLGVISNTSGVVLSSPKSATVYSQDGTTINIYFGDGATWILNFSDITTIGGTTPAHIGDAIYLISSLIFPPKEAIIDLTIPL